MSYHLPAADSPIRELIDMRALVALGQRENVLRLPSLPQAIDAGRKTIEADKRIRATHSIVVRGDGRLTLHRVTARSHRHVWNFGPVSLGA